MVTKVMHYVNDAVQSSDNATYRLELPNRGALHSIILKAQCTNGATSARGVNMLDVIDEVEVIGDGSEVLFSLYPAELEKWSELWQQRELTMVEDQTADSVQEIVFPIMFGRKVYDPNFWLRLARFSQVTLEVAYSPNIAADQGFATGTVTFDVELVITPDDGALNYQGTLVTRRLYSYTTAASGDEEIEIPDQAVIRAIGNYCYEAAIADGVDITSIVLEDKSNGNKIFEADWDDLIHVNRELFGVKVEHMAVLLLANNETWASRIGEVLNYSVEEFDTPDATNDAWNIARVDGIAGDTLTFALANADITAGSETLTDQSSDMTLKAVVEGKAPSYFGVIPFTYEDNPNGWLKTADYGRIVVKQTNGAAGGAAYVSIQEMRRF